MPVPIRSKPATSATSTNGACGRTSSCRTASCSFPASSVTPPTSSSIRELVADRIVRYAKIVGRENVIAGTDCGLGGRIHPQIAWAKLEALSEGAKLASRQLWP